MVEVHFFIPAWLVHGLAGAVLGWIGHFLYVANATGDLPEP